MIHDQSYFFVLKNRHNLIVKLTLPMSTLNTLHNKTQLQHTNKQHTLQTEAESIQQLLQQA